MFNDGDCDVYKVIDRRVDEKKETGCGFSEQSVGERRHWDAYVAGVLIVRTIRVRKETNVDFGDLVVIGDEQYIVVQKDLKDDRMPESWLLSLQKSPIEYKTADPDPDPEEGSETDGGDTVQD
jgi:hypothetical protein